MPPDEQPATGHHRVDAAIVRLRALDDAPVDQHPDVYHAVHEELRVALTEAGADAGEPADGPGASS